MSDNDLTQSNEPTTASGRPRRRAAGRPAGPPAEVVAASASAQKVTAKNDDKTPVKKAANSRPTRAAKTSTAKPEISDIKPANDSSEDKPVKRPAKKAAVAVPIFQAPATTVAPAKRTPAKAKAESSSQEDSASDKPTNARSTNARKNAESNGDGVAKKTANKRPAKKASVRDGDESANDSNEVSNGDDNNADVDGEGGDARNGRRRSRRGGRNRNKGRTAGSANGDDENEDSESSVDGEDTAAESGDDSTESTSARSRSRKRTRDRSGDDESGSTRVEAKRARRTNDRSNGRRRAPILTESEFLARRENVERVMVVRQQGARTQIAVLEDGVLVEHYINQSSSGSLIGNVYLGRVQNVLPGMEAAFVDIGKGRNAVLYAGEVNWDTAGTDGQPKRIETALKTGDTVLVQVTKDPVGQKGARLTSQISLPGRFLVYVPNHPMTGISRKLPDRERSRLKSILRQVVPADAGVIVRTAAEGAAEADLQVDVSRLAAQWTDIEEKSKSMNAPVMLYGEPDISIKVVRDIFNEDVKKLIVSGDDAWDIVNPYVTYVAPDLADRMEKHVGADDVFASFRIDEQLAKALDRKVFLPSGGSLVIDRTEAMTVVDVNTGKFIGQGGNLEQTVTKNNLEAAEEIVRQLRLRDIGGIIVIDFIDMVLESNRDQVIRRLIECLGRDRTKHQVAEVTSLGLVQMTRKRIGAGLLEVFSEPCDHCNGRGVVIHTDGQVHTQAVQEQPKSEKTSASSSKGRRGKKSAQASTATDETKDTAPKTPKNRGKKRVVLEMFEPPPPIDSLGF